MNHVYDSYDSEIYVIFIELAQYGDEQDFFGGGNSHATSLGLRIYWKKSFAYILQFSGKTS